MSSPLPWKWTQYAVLFLSVWIILSLWAGYAGLLSPVLIIIALIITYVLQRYFPLSHEKETIPLTTIGIGLLIVLAMGFIFFGVQGGYDLSADAAPNVATIIIQSQIPSTYTPYFDLPVFYQMGLPSMASQLVIGGIQPHHALWAFALIGILFAMLGLSQLAKQLHFTPAIAVWIPILFVATRIPFSNLLLGEYPWLLAMGLGFMSIALLQRSHVLGTIVLAAAMITHPYIGVISAFAWVVLFFPPLKQLIQTIIGVGIVSIPVIQHQILEFIGIAREPLSSTEPLALANFIASIHLIGLIPFVLAVAWVIEKIINHKKFTRIDYALIGIGFGGFILSVWLNAQFPELILGTKIPALVLIGIVLMAGQFLSTMIKPSQHIPVMGIIIVLALALIATSTSMQSMIGGSKVSLEEAQFSTRLYEYDSQVVPVLFLSNSVGKMAQYSHKIPSDPRGAHFMLALQLLRTPRALELKEQSDLHREMLQNKCVECVESFLEKYPQKYIVVNTQQFPALQGKNEIFRTENIILYSN